MRAFDRLQLPPQATLTRGTVIKIGQLVGATTVVTGRVELLDRTLALHVQSVRIDTGRISLEFDERGRLDDLLAIVERAAGGSSRPAPRRRRRRHTAVAAGLRAVRQGPARRDARRPDRLPGKALALEPTFDRARLALGRARAVTGEWTGARRGAGRAGRSRPRRPRPVRGRRRRDWAPAVRRSLRALQGAGRCRPDAPEVFNNLGVIQLRRGADRADRPVHLFLQQGRRGRSRAGRLRVQPGLRLLARAGLRGGRVLAARGRAARPRATATRTSSWARRCRPPGAATEAGARARAGAAAVGGVRGAGRRRRRRCRAAPTSSGSGPTSIRRERAGRTPR